MHGMTRKHFEQRFRIFPSLHPIQFSDLNQLVPLYSSASYATSKAGLGMLTQNAALELARHRIRVNALLPGLTDTRST